MPTAKERREELREIVKKSEEEMDDLWKKQNAEEGAKTLRTIYDSLIEQGFEEYQAWDMTMMMVEKSLER